MMNTKTVWRCAELIEAMMANERFVLPKSASFMRCIERREPGNGERIDQALHAIEEANTKLKDAGKSVFQDISFNTDRLGEENRRTPSCVSCWKTLPVKILT
jgi:type I restriction enzyme M protein